MDEVNDSISFFVDGIMMMYYQLLLMFVSGVKFQAVVVVDWRRTTERQ
jgi:hypothetical protein